MQNFLLTKTQFIFGYQFSRKQIFILLLALIPLWGNAQQNGQVIEGRIVDAVSQTPLPGATVVVQDSYPTLGTMTDTDGNFKLLNIKPGRYNLKVSFIGYENFLFREVLVGSGKEVVLNAGLKELISEINEVKVTARTSKEQASNPMATISARQLSVEESSRYAGGYDDPARLAGSFAHYFGLNNELSLEPRFGLKWKFAPDQSFGLAYGLNSRIEMIGFYLARQQTGSGIIQPNKNLKMSKAHHFGLAWDWLINPDLRLKVEPYYQYLYDIPVVPNCYFSLQNLELDWFFNETLVNKGTGTNLGIDFTLERFLKKGFYYLITTSVFDSKYKGGDGIERNGLYNKHFIFNVLGGKEWRTGKSKNNILGINGRLTYMGGDRLTTILEAASIETGEIIYDYSKAYSGKEKNATVLSFSISYRINKQKHAGIWSFHLMNALGNKEFRGYEINDKTGLPEKKFDRIVVPNLSYKIEF